MLYIFDIDGTLIDDTGKFLPGVERWFQNRQSWHQVALATNQGGPACHDAGWTWSDTYPALAEVEMKYGALASFLKAKLFMSLVYVTKNGNLLIPEGLPADDPRLNPNWRKPKPGMLQAALQHFGYKPSEAVFVGDRSEDEDAARAAGVSFVPASQFFEKLIIHSADGTAVKIYGDYSSQPVICKMDVVMLFGGYSDAFHGIKALQNQNMLPRMGSESRPLKKLDIFLARDNAERGERYWQYRQFTGLHTRRDTGYDTVRGYGYRDGSDFVIVETLGEDITQFVRYFTLRGVYD